MLLVAKTATWAYSIAMEYFECECSAELREASLVAQMKPRQQALWYVKRDCQLFADLKTGRHERLELALWAFDGVHRIEHILGKDSPDLVTLTCAMRPLRLLARGFVPNANRQLCQPAIEAIANILNDCKAKLDAWSDQEAEEHLSARILKFVDVSSA